MFLNEILRIRCHKFLMGFDEFNDQEHLRAILGVIESLKPLADKLPETKTKSARVDGVLHYTVNHRYEGELLLLILFRVLSSSCQGDDRKSELNELTVEIKNADDFSPYNQKLKVDENEDFQQFTQSYDSIDEADLGEAQRWLEEVESDIEEWVFRIALAVFNGTTYETIDRAKKELLQMRQQPSPLQQHNNPPTTTPPAIPLKKGRRLERAGAIEKRESPMKPRVVELLNSNLPYKALRFVWQEYGDDDFHKQLITWLTNYASGFPAEIRTRAAVAAGVLAKADYVFVRDNLLLKWARQEDSQYRAAVGKALGYLASDQQWRDEVNNLLSFLADSPSPEQRWAAARAYIYIGAHYSAKDAIKQWRMIARSEDIAIKIAIGESFYFRLPLYMSLADTMVTYFVNATQLSDESSEEKRRKFFEEGLEGLEEWVKADAQAGVKLGFGQSIFFTLTRVVMPGESLEENWPPVLLHLVDAQNPQSSYCQRLAGLFNRALVNPTIFREALEPLRAWLEWMNQDNLLCAPQYEARMASLLGAVIDYDQRNRNSLRDRLKFTLKSWANHFAPNIKSAQNVLDRLTGNST